eukprot:10363589-Lingulodinium_polyedra.AAC.1
MVAIAGQVLRANSIQLGWCALSTFARLLRPIGTCQLLTKHLAASSGPEAGVGSWSLLLRESSLNALGKTGIVDDPVPLDNCAGLAP